MAVWSRTANPRGFAVLGYLTPAIVVSVAYIDPGNFATNVAAGASQGYRLLWVVVLASVVAMLFQSLSSKLALITGKTLATHIRQTLPRPAAIGAWLLSEVAAFATELAEVLGAALAFHMLLGTPLIVGALLTFALVGIVLALQRYAFRPHEAIVVAMVGVVAAAYCVESALAQPAWVEVVRGATQPWLAGRDSIALAVAIVGATVMPHALYYHGSLVRERAAEPAWRSGAPAVRNATIGVVAALGVAGLVNLAMMYVSASAFYGHGQTGLADLAQAYRGLIPVLGAGAATMFAIALLTAGISSSIVGAAAGQAIFEDFTSFKLPLWVRRSVTMIPPLAIVAAGADVTTTLVASQIVLSLVLPVPLVALVYFTSSRATMGHLANSPIVATLAIVSTAIVIAMNVALIVRL